MDFKNSFLKKIVVADFYENDPNIAADRIVVVKWLVEIFFQDFLFQTLPNCCFERALSYRPAFCQGLPGQSLLLCCCRPLRVHSGVSGPPALKTAGFEGKWFHDPLRLPKTDPLRQKTLISNSRLSGYRNQSLD